MCYIKAEDIFPKEIMDLIWEYVEGEYIYIPKKEGNRKKWGETTNTRKEIKIRNEAIYEEYNNDIDKESLANKYFLSRKSIDRIILQEKRK
ncbi:MAG: CD3324 family protein [Clostridiaceae bacterium]